MLLSVIIPTYNASSTLCECLTALHTSHYPDWECIVVDDGSSDNSMQIARECGARVIVTARPFSGPAYARNLGAKIAKGDILVFLDADVVVQPGTLGQMAAILQADPELAACFGSYDDQPSEPDFLSQYRNLLHHYLHQTSSIDAHTFWSGCGAIRRQIFLDIGGFNATVYQQRGVEDIELGYRLRAAEHRIALDKLLQVKHLKRWQIGRLLNTDIRKRAIPWSQLILQQGRLPDDLNLQPNQRISGVTVLLAALVLIGAPWLPWLLLFLPFAALLLLRLNSHFYRFLAAKRGWRFTLAAIPWHWFYFGYSSATFAGCIVWHTLLRRPNPAPVRGRPYPAIPSRPFIPMEVGTP